MIFGENYKVIFHDFDPNESDTLTNVNSTNWIDVKDVLDGCVLAIRTVGTGSLQDAGLYVSASPTGTSASLVGSLTGSTAATGLLNAANGSIAEPDVGRLVINFTRDDIAKANPDGRYISARASLATGTDEFGVLYILRMKDGKADTLVTGNDA